MSAGMSDDLTAFLAARLDEDEQAARIATYCQEDAGEDVLTWHVEDGEVCGSDGSGIISAITQHPGMLAHIARHDPARVLREVEAERKVIELHADTHECPGFDRSGTWPPVPCDTLRCLASVYADHPEFRDQWKVELIPKTWMDDQ